LGVLFQFGVDQASSVVRFVADEQFIRLDNPPTLSLSMMADDPEAQRALWANVSAPVFNGRYSARNGGLLPAFFQGLLPEGVFREHVAQRRQCDPKDHFEMLAACGLDLPGNVYVRPIDLERQELAQLITQNAEPLEPSVVAEPMEEGVSVSGVQPKVGVFKEAAVHELLRRIIVNELLGNPDMHLKNIGVIYLDGKTPTLSLAYDIVAYSAYHRRQGHALPLLPVAAGEKLKIRAESADARKIAQPGLSSLILRTFCSALGLPEKPAASVIQQAVLTAVKHWPAMIESAKLTTRQKTNLLQYFSEHPMVRALAKRQERYVVADL
jgi:hypothetical protein